MVTFFSDLIDLTFPTGRRAAITLGAVAIALALGAYQQWSPGAAVVVAALTWGTALLVIELLSRSCKLYRRWTSAVLSIRPCADQEPFKLRIQVVNDGVKRAGGVQLWITCLMPDESAADEVQDYARRLSGHCLLPAQASGGNLNPGHSDEFLLCGGENDRIWFSPDTDAHHVGNRGIPAADFMVFLAATAKGAVGCQAVFQILHFPDRMLLLPLSN